MYMTLETTNEKKLLFSRRGSKSKVDNITLCWSTFLNWIIFLTVTPCMDDLSDILR